ncbi:MULTISPECIES: twin-arginine translocation signal domain-containing protein [Bacteria]|uniref:twin-arginine translocation signal domain-containing protein n=1 Tax=Bacteria TaxID=2 RepID=UPI003C7C479A
MSSTPSSPQGLSRRGFLGASLAAGVLLVVDPSPVSASASAGDVTLAAAGISVVASVGGRIAIRDGAGVIRSQGSRFQVKDSATGIHVSTGGQPTLVTTADGQPAIRMEYVFAAAAGPVTVVGTVTVSTDRAHLEWRVDGPSTLVPDGFLFSRAILAATEPDDYIAVTTWTRDAGGGIPYEKPAGVAHTSAWGAQHGMFLLERSRQAWTNSTWIHSPGTALDGGGYLSRADFFFTATRPSATASIGLGHALGVDLSTDRDFNLLAPNDPPIALTALIANGTASGQDVEVRGGRATSTARSSPRRHGPRSCLGGGARRGRRLGSAVSARGRARGPVLRRVRACGEPARRPGERQPCAHERGQLRRGHGLPRTLPRNERRPCASTTRLWRCGTSRPWRTAPTPSTRYNG